MCHFPPHVSSETTLPWEITEQKMTHFTVSNILFCEETTFCDTFDCWKHLLRQQDTTVILAVHLHPRVDKHQFSHTHL